MTNRVKSIPDGYHVVTPYLFIKGAAKALEFYEKVELSRELPNALLNAEVMSA
jgi:PhnB protein